MKMRVLLFLLLPLGVLCSRPNVLFLVSDDLRPQLGCYEGSDFPSPVHPKAITPNIDMLASRSLLLRRAYVQQALCSPSRTSLLTGRRPDTTHAYDLYHYFRQNGGNFTTIPQYFKQHGYRTIGMGKIFHPGHASGGDDPPSWTDPYFQPPNFDYWQSRNYSWIAVPPEWEAQYPLPDVQTKDHAIQTLQELVPAARNGSRPFFVAVGLYKPHLPYTYPERFQKFYPKEDIHQPPNPYAPVGMPPEAWYDYGDLRLYHDIENIKPYPTGAINTTLPPDVILNLRRAYYGAVTYVDSLIGELLAELDSLGLSKNTIVSLWGDHGQQLGEHGEWCKQTNFEVATHAPMMVHIPGLTEHGIASEALTEFVDLFPTLAEAAGLPTLPTCPENSSYIAVCTEGHSLMPLIKGNMTSWKQAAFSQFPRSTESPRIMGYSIRTDSYRYTEWVHFSQAEYRPLWSKIVSAELYDHKKDPEENLNAAYDTAYASVREDLRKRLHAGWRHA